MTGTFVAVVGASGTGKDTIIGIARDRLADDARFRFVRRAVTRPADTQAEDHAPMDEQAFGEAARRGDFALWWRAHELSYGIPAIADDDIARGRVVVANLSRTILPAMAARYPRHLVVEVTVPAGLRAKRLAARGRENGEAVALRLDRAVEFERTASIVSIDNSGPPELAGELFSTVLTGLVEGQAGRIVPLSRSL